MAKSLSNPSTCIDKSILEESRPIYLQVAFQLETYIKRSLKPGDYLDSEMSLAKRFSVNRHTVRHAIEQLVRAGIVVKQKGKGTQVVANQLEYLLNPAGKFTKNLNDLGKTANAQLVSNRVVLFEELPTNVQRYFDAVKHRGAPMAEMVTLRFIENMPVCIIRHHLSLVYLPEIDKSYQSGSLHQHISERFGYTLKRARLIVSAILAKAGDAIQLKCAVDSPLVELQSVNRIIGSQDVVEVSISHSRPDRLQYQIDFKGE